MGAFFCAAIAQFWYTGSLLADDPKPRSTGICATQVSVMVSIAAFLADTENGLGLTIGIMYTNLAFEAQRPAAA